MKPQSRISADTAHARTSRPRDLPQHFGESADRCLRCRHAKEDRVLERRRGTHHRLSFGAFAELNIPFGILCLRLEGLSQFRSNFSQEAASALLRVFARTLSGALWRTDFVGRWSDDSFLMILNGCTNDSLLAVRE